MLSHNWRINAAAVAILAVVAAANAGERSPAPARIVTSKGKAVEIVAHRGASYDAPENTLASLRLAWRQNADASEFDVFQTKDGRLVVLHDKDTKRTAPGQANLVVAETPFDRLRTLDVGAWKNAKFKGEKIPTLAEMIGATPAGKRLFIEIKAGSEAVPELDRVLRDSKIDPAMTPIISFHSNVIAAVKARRPELPAFWIASLNPKNHRQQSS